MKRIHYIVTDQVNVGSEEQPIWESRPGAVCTLPYSEENLVLAEAEAFGEVTVEDDGVPEPEEVPSEEDVTLDLLADHEYRLCMLELGGDMV